MKNKYKPFFYEKKKTSFRKILLIIISAAAFLTYTAFQIPGIRQIIAEPLFACGSFLINAAHDLFDATRMYHEPEKKPEVWTPLELPDRDVLFAESLENLSAVSQEDPLAALRQTPTPSDYARVADWEYLDPSMNYALNASESDKSEAEDVMLVPPVFEHADLFSDGPAILSAALRFWGVVENQYHIAGKLHPDVLDPDCSFSEMEKYIADSVPGYSAVTRINGDKNLLIGLLQKEIPVIIRIGSSTPLRFWLKDDRFIARYLLIHGYDSSTDSFYCQDTYSSNNRLISADTLLADWYLFQRTYMVLYPEEKETDVRDILSENFYGELNLQQAEYKFRTDSEILTENAFAQYNYGAVLHRTGDEAGAWQYFQKASELSLPQRYLNYLPDILETAFALGYADDMDRMIDPNLRRNSHDEVLLVYSGWADILRGNTAEGAGKFERAEKINPHNDLVLYAIKYKETMLS